MGKKYCKYCDKPSQKYFNKQGRHKSFLVTCGSKECISKRYKQRKKPIFGKLNCQKCYREIEKKGATQKWCNQCVPNFKARQIIQRYGLTWPEYLSLKKSNDECPICKTRKPSVVDHCHKSKKVRGFICNHCNTALSLIEKPIILARAIKYIEVSNAI